MKGLEKRTGLKKKNFEKKGKVGKSLNMHKTLLNHSNTHPHTLLCKDNKVQNCAYLDPVGRMKK
jgi:hypothetical protein